LNNRPAIVDLIAAGGSMGFLQGSIWLA